MRLPWRLSEKKTEKKETISGYCGLNGILWFKNKSAKTFEMKNIFLAIPLVCGPLENHTT